MLKDRIFKISFIIILIALLLIGLYMFFKGYFISVNKTTDTVDDANSTVDLINARSYVQSVETVIVSELFNTDIIAGKYIVNNNKIIYQDNKNIYYEIPSRGSNPLDGSIIILKDDKVLEATIKYEKNTIYYDGLTYIVKDI